MHGTVMRGTVAPPESETRSSRQGSCRNLGDRVSRTQARWVCGAVWKMKDRPFEVGFREQASNHPKRHRLKAVVVSVGGKDTGQVWITETSVSEPLMTCRNIFWRRRNQERSWDKVGRCPMMAQPASGMEVA